MKFFFNKYNYLFIGLAPVIVYTMSCWLFETNAESTLYFKNAILDRVVQVKSSPELLVAEYKARILWQCSSLLSILSYLLAIVWSCSLLCRCCVDGAHKKRIALLGVSIVTLTLLQLINASTDSAIYNGIFSTTFEAVSASTIYSAGFPDKVNVVIGIVNLLAVITPVFILVAVCSTLTVTKDDADLSFFIDRVGFLKQGILAGSIILLFGVIHMAAWTQWPKALIPESDFSKLFEEYVHANCQFWGLAFSLLLVSLYFSSMVVLKARVQCALTTLPGPEERQKWLKDKGFTISFQKHALQLGMMLMPSLAGSLGSVFELI